MAEFALVQNAARTTTGTQDYTVSGFGTPKLAMFFVTFATANNTETAHAVLGIGSTDGTRNVSTTYSDKDAVATTVCKSRGNTSNCVLLHNQDGTVIGRAAFSSWITDGVRINWSTAPASGYLVTCLLVGGSVSNAYTNVATVPFGTEPTLDVTAPGFEPDIVISYAVEGNAFNDTQRAAFTPNMGFAVRGANPATQRGLHQYDYDAVALPSSFGGSRFSTARSWVEVASNTIALTVQDIDSSGFSYSQVGTTGSDLEIAYVAINLPASLSATILSIDAPTSTGSYSITGAGFTPQFAMMLLSDNTAYQSVLGFGAGNGETFGIGLSTSAAQYCVSTTMSDSEAAATNTSSITDSKPINTRLDGAALGVETFTAFTSDGMTLNATTANGTTRKRAVLFVKQGGQTVVADGGSYAASGQEVLFRVGSPLYLRHRK